MVDVVGRAVVKVVGELDSASFQKAGTAGGSVLTRTLATGVKAAGVGIGAVLAGSIAKGFGRLRDIEQAEAKLKGLGNSAKTVAQVMKDANAAVLGTSFGLGEAASIAASAVAAGVKPGQDLQRTLKLVADSATIAGTDLNDMGAIFNKVAATNKVQGEVLQQLGERGIPIIQLLAKTLHVSAAEVVDLASQGEIGFKEFQTALEAGLGGAALESGKTFTGALANAGAALGRFGAALIGKEFSGAPALFGAITKKIDEITPVAEKVGTAIFNAIGPTVTTTIKVVKTAFDVLKTSISAVVTVVSNPVFQAFAAAIATLLIPALTVWVAQIVILNTQMLIFVARAAIVNAATVAWTAAQWLLNAALLANPVGIVIAVLAALAVLFVVLWKRSETFRAIVMATWEGIKAGAKAAFDFIKKVGIATWDAIKAGASALKNFFVGVWNGIKTVASTVWGAIKTVVVGTINGIITVANGIKTAFEKIWDGIKVAGLTAFNVLKRAINNIIDGINTAIDLVNAIPGVPDVGHIPKLAVGASNFPGGLAIVGERGPELVNLPKGSDVFTNRESRQLAASSTGDTINNNTIVFNGPTSLSAGQKQAEWWNRYGSRFGDANAAVGV